MKYLAITLLAMVLTACSVSVELTRTDTDGSTVSAKYTRPIFVDQSIEEVSLTKDTETGIPVFIMKGQKSDAAAVTDSLVQMNSLLSNMLQIYLKASTPLP